MVKPAAIHPKGFQKLAKAKYAPTAPKPANTKSIRSPKLKSNLFKALSKSGLTETCAGFPFRLTEEIYWSKSLLRCFIFELRLEISFEISSCNSEVTFLIISLD